LTNLANQYSAKLSSPDERSGNKNGWRLFLYPGYIAPDMEDKYIRSDKQLHPKFLRLVDKTAVELENFVTGANESGYRGRCQLG